MKRQAIVYERTPLGQALWDVVFSRMSAAEAGRRHPEVTREFILTMRRKYAKMRRMGRK